MYVCLIKLWDGLSVLRDKTQQEPRHGNSAGGQTGRQRCCHGNKSNDTAQSVITVFEGFVMAEMRFSDRTERWVIITPLYFCHFQLNFSWNCFIFLLCVSYGWWTPVCTRLPCFLFLTYITYCGRWHSNRQASALLKPLQQISTCLKELSFQNLMIHPVIHQSPSSLRLETEM